MDYKNLFPYNYGKRYANYMHLNSCINVPNVSVLIKTLFECRNALHSNTLN